MKSAKFDVFWLHEWRDKRQALEVESKEPPKCIQQQQHPSQDYISMLIEEAEKLYIKLAKELGDET